MSARDLIGVLHGWMAGVHTDRKSVCLMPHTVKASYGAWAVCRRQIQLQSATRVPARQVIRNVLAAEGVAGFYRGFVPNAANKGV